MIPKITLPMLQVFIFTVVVLLASAPPCVESAQDANYLNHNQYEKHHAMNDDSWSAARLQQEINRAIQQDADLLQIPSSSYRFADHNTSLVVANATSLILEPQGPVIFVFSGEHGIDFQHCTDVTFGRQDDAENGVITIDYDPLPPPQPSFGERSGITLNMFNCTRINTYNVIIRAAPFMGVTAYHGGGGHVYKNLRFIPHTEHSRWAALRDATHFANLRKGPTIVDSLIGFSGDDFFNVHTTLLVVLECHNATAGTDKKDMCTLVNPHVTMGAPRNSVYGTFSLLSHVQRGDQMSFYKWPNEDMIIRRINQSDGHYDHGRKEEEGPYTVAQLEPETDPAVLAEAAKLPARTASRGWIGVTNRTTNYTADEVWRVYFDRAPPFLVSKGDLVSVDTISASGATFINNTFLHSGCNIGRIKSSNALFRNNYFQFTRVPNLEISVLPQWFEGPVEIRNVTFESNTFVFPKKKDDDEKGVFEQMSPSGLNPIHCGPLCEKPGCETPPACATCPDCSKDTPWAKQVVFVNNSFLPKNDFQSSLVVGNTL